MREFMALAKSLNIRYSVPEPFKKVIESDIVVTDEECLSNYLVNSEAAYLITRNNLKSIVLELAGVRGVETLLVGIDVGSSLAYAAFANNKLLRSGKVKSIDNLMKILEELRYLVRPSKTIVKVGEPAFRSAGNSFIELIDNLTRLGYIVYIVEENDTSRNAPALLRGNVKDKDVNAAVNIALKDGLRVIK